MTEAEASRLWRKVRPDSAGLVPCVVQDLRSAALLMVAWVSEEALRRSLQTGYATYWSRSRGQIWEKGATSGSKQKLVEVRLDCDGDTLLYRVDPEGPACHEGFDSCFYRRQVGSGWRDDPEAVLGRPSGRSAVFRDLEQLIETQASASRSSTGGATKSLFEGGMPAQGARLKLQAEALTHGLTAKDLPGLTKEAGELLYLVAVALRSRKLSLADAFESLMDRAWTE